VDFSLKTIESSPRPQRKVASDSLLGMKPKVSLKFSDDGFQLSDQKVPQKEEEETG
jgi:hypothetical protein